MPFSWDAFLTRYGPMARALASPLVRPPATAEDVVQEASLALHAALERDPQRFATSEEARNYFLRAVHNLAARSRRDARGELPLERDPVGPDAGDPDARLVRERQAALGKMLLELDPGARALIVQRFLERRTLASIARASGVPVSTLHDRERALLAELRRRLTRLDQETAG